ncbi:flagellar basal-body rod modification protein FlgD [Caldicoprobacter faecalis]|uniref:Flagellar basal-body rod modification protein FlgD n=1 Tax=Caldicoprobacter faecalis TaxID=937334 RepID=A0A1I5RNI1_9FIRM|nr:flagellar basal-body rod modification protein FlgD [Caldicoprobacter faecalis]
MYVSGVNNQSYAAATQKGPVNQLGKDAFLKLLITQLRYQDPLRPMEDREFIAQLAQFSTLELMQNLSSDFTSIKAVSLIGKTVYAEKRAEDSAGVLPIRGKVESVSLVNGKVSLRVNGYDIALEDVKEIYSDEKATEGDE